MTMAQGPPPDFSVVVATHDRPALLHEALASVQRQTVTSFECLVVDDASSVPAVVPADPRFRLVRLEANAGCAAARNVGIEQAQGAAVVFLDDDDVYGPDRLALAARGLTRAPVALCWRYWLGADPATAPPDRVLEGDVHDSILDTYTPSLGQTAVRRDVLELMDPTWTACEDVEWWLRMSRRAPVTTVPQHAYAVRKHDGGRQGNGQDARLAGSVRLLDEHRDYYAAHPVARAFRHERVASMLAEQGQRAPAVGHAVRAVTADPHPRRAARLARELLRRR